MQKRHNNKLAGLWSLLAGLFLFVPIAKADHVLGGEITYTYQTGKTYKFKVVVYRDCRACDFNTQNCQDISSLDVFTAPDETNPGTKLTTIALKKVGKKDITQICPTAKSICQPGANVSYGVEAVELEGSLDFSNYLNDYCKFEVGLRLESRKNVWNSGDFYYNFARLNICNNQSNHSAEFRSDAWVYFPQNQPIHYNLMARDPDGDSLSYKLVKAQKAFNREIQYPLQYPEDRPLNIYCTSTACDFNGQNWPVEGMKLDATTGWLAFTPTDLNQQGFLVIEVTEWRKVGTAMLKMGVTRRDIQFEVVTANDLAPRVRINQDEYFACAGSTFSMDFSVTDAVFNGVKDSVKLEVVSDLNGSEVGSVGSVSNSFDAFFTCKPKSSEVRSSPYLVHIIARDNRCPQNITAIRTIKIKVVNPPSLKYKSYYSGCDVWTVEALEPAKNKTTNFYLFDASMKMLEASNGNKYNFVVPSGGTYFIKAEAVQSQSGCTVSKIDTIKVPQFKKIQSTITWPSQVCAGTRVNFDASFNGGTKPFQYFWNGVRGTKNYSVIVNNGTNVKLRVLDTLGCELKVEREVQIFKPLEVLSKDTEICVTQSINPYELFQFDKTKVIKATIQFIGSGTLTDMGMYQAQYKSERAEQATFQLILNDQNGCTYSYVAKSNIEALPKTGFGTIRKICSNEKEVNLRQESGLNLEGGYWILYGHPNALDGDIIYPEMLNPGAYWVKYFNNESVCGVIDSLKVEIISPPVVEWVSGNKLYTCSNIQTLQLTASPAGGTWKANGFVNENGELNPINAYHAGVRSLTTEYYYLDPSTGCSNRLNGEIIINGAPSLAGLPSLDICEKGSLSFTPEFKNIKKYSWQLPAGKNIELINTDPQHTLLIKDGVAPGNYALYYFLEALDGCEDVTVVKDIQVKPLPIATLEANKATGCSPLDVSLQWKYAGMYNPISAQWWVDGSMVADTLLKMSFTLFDAGEHTIKSRAALAGCFADYSEKKFWVNPSPIADISSLTGFAVRKEYPEIELTDNSRSTGSHITFWSVPVGQASSNVDKTIKIKFPAVPGVYSVSLRVSESGGCSDTASVKVRVLKGMEVYVPDAFSPNQTGPSANETFKPVFDQPTTEFKLEVFDRWGGLVFMTKDPQKGWDGMFGDKPSPAGWYIWKLTARGEAGDLLERNGTFALIR